MYNRTLEFHIYGDYILETLFESETKMLKINFYSDQLDFRKSMIKTMKYFARSQNYTLATLHLGEL
jgi:hypothetical protein